MVEQNNIQTGTIAESSLERISQALFVLAELAEKQRDFELAGKLRAGMAKTKTKENSPYRPGEVLGIP